MVLSMKDGSLFVIMLGSASPDFMFGDYKEGDCWNARTLFNWDEFRVPENYQKFIREDEKPNPNAPFVLAESFNIFVVLTISNDKAQEFA